MKEELLSIEIHWRVAVMVTINEIDRHLERNRKRQKEKNVAERTFAVN